MLCAHTRNICDVYYCREFELWMWVAISVWVTIICWVCSTITTYHGNVFFFSACVSYIRTLGMFTSVWSSHARTHALSINICNTHTHAARTQNSQVEMTCEWCMCVRVPFLTMWCDIIINITMSLCVLYHDDEVRVIEAWKWYSAHCHRRHPHMTKCPPSLVVLVMTISSKA